jgi:glycosyltransferase involved in cell wall biosynthesis
LKKTNVGVIIAARNEEKFIGKILENLQQQKLKPYKIVVVNDNSNDDTELIASRFKSVKVIPSNVPINREWKDVVGVINAGLTEFSNDLKCDFIMRLDSDHILPFDYISTIVERMNQNPTLVIASGKIQDEYSVVPRGSGRIISTVFFKKINYKLPINYGWDAYMLLKAKSLDYDFKLFEDISSNVLRKTGSKNFNSKLFLNRGKAFKALGYIFPYVLKQITIQIIKNPVDGVWLLIGYLSKNTNLYEPELRKFVKNLQYNKLGLKNKNYLN